MSQELYNASAGTLSHEVFIVGDTAKVETVIKTVKSGQDLAEKEVVAMETASGQIVTFDEGGSGGAEVALYISVYAVDATGGAQKASFYKAGDFNEDLVVWSGTPTDIQKANAFKGTPISLSELRA